MKMDYNCHLSNKQIKNESVQILKEIWEMIHPHQIHYNLLIPLMLIVKLKSKLVNLKWPIYKKMKLIRFWKMMDRTYLNRLVRLVKN